MGYKGANRTGGMLCGAPRCLLMLVLCTVDALAGRCGGRFNVKVEQMHRAKGKQNQQSADGAMVFTIMLMQLPHASTPESVVDV